MLLWTRRRRRTRLAGRPQDRQDHTASPHDGYRTLPQLPDDWRVEDYADGDLFADLGGSRRVEERDRRWLETRRRAIAEERARRG